MSFWYVKTMEDENGLLCVAESFCIGESKKDYLSIGNYFETQEEAVAFAKDFNDKLWGRRKEVNANNEYYYTVENRWCPAGLFGSRKRLKDEDNSVEENELKQYGNYFETREEADKYADKINSIIVKNGASGKDKNGNTVYMFDKVKVPSGEIMFVDSIARDGDVVWCMYNLDNRTEKQQRFETKDVGKCE